MHSSRSRDLRDRFFALQEFFNSYLSIVIGHRVGGSTFEWKDPLKTKASTSTVPSQSARGK